MIRIIQKVTYRCDGCEAGDEFEYLIAEGSPLLRPSLPEGWIALPNLGYHYCPDCYSITPQEKAVESTGAV